MGNVLVIDENKEVLKSLQYFFQSDELKYIDFADSANKAIKLLDVNKYETVITELFFVKENISAKDILKKAKDKDVPNRVILTSNSKNVNYLECFATFLTRKPITKKKFSFLYK